MPIQQDFPVGDSGQRLYRLGLVQGRPHNILKRYVKYFLTQLASIEEREITKRHTEDVL